MSLNQLRAAALTLLMVTSVIVVWVPVTSGIASADTTAPSLTPGPIASGGVIDQPGVYTLTQDISYPGGITTAFEVKTSDVVIDGAGYTISSNGTGEAVYAHGETAPLSNVTVTDLTITNFETAVKFLGVEDGTVQDSVIDANADAGIAISGQDTVNTRVLNNVISGNSKGVTVGEGVSYTNLTNNDIIANSESGVKIRGGSYNTLDGNYVADQFGTKGVHITGRSPHNTIVNNVIENQASTVENALQIGGESVDNNVSFNVVRNNARGGIQVGPADNVIKGNEIYDNGDAGLTLEESGNTVTENEIYGNDRGLWLNGASGNTIHTNVVKGNTWDYYGDRDGISNVVTDLVIDDVGTTVSFQGTNVALTSAVSPAPDPVGHTNIGTYVETASVGLNSHLDLTVHYTDADVASVDESSLRLWKHDTDWQLVGSTTWQYDYVADAWEEQTLPGTNDVDVNNNYVRAIVTEFGVLAPMDGTTGTTGSGDLGVTDASLSSSTAGVGEAVDATATIENTGSADATVTADLTIDGTVADTQTVTIPASNTTDVTFVYANSAPGTYDVVISGADAGTLTVQDVTPPVADAGADQAVSVDQPVAFDASASSDNLGIVSYEWDFDDGTNATGESVTHTYTSDGTYTVTLNVTDAAGNSATDTLTVTVDADAVPPTPEAGADQTVDVGDLVSFDASASSDNYGIVSYEWDFDDGYTATGPTVSHRYFDTGTYAVALTVTDYAGNNATDVVNVTVERPPQPPQDDDGDSVSSGSSVRSRVEEQVTARRDVDGSIAVQLRATAGEQMQIGLDWSAPDRATGIQLREMTVTANQDGDHQLRINTQTALRENAQEFDGTQGEPLGYLDVSHTLAEDEIDGASFTFRLEKQALERRGVDAEDVGLYRYQDGEWVRLQTQVVGETDTQYTFHAESPGLSVFAVVLDGSQAISVTTDLESVPATVTVGDVVEVTGTVENDGTADATFDVTLTADGEVIGERTVTVPAKTSLDVTFSHVFGETGTYDLSLNGEDLGSVTVEQQDAPETDEPEDTDEPVTQVDDETEAPDGQAGFGLLLAALAVLAAAFLAHRRD